MAEHSLLSPGGAREAHQVSLLEAVGSSGPTPPATTGTGLAGWLRAIYERLAAGLGVTGAVAVTNLPSTQTVAGTVAVSNLPATQAVSGTVTVANPTASPETGLAKDATLAQVRDRLPAAPLAQGLTNGELRAARVGVADDYALDRITVDQTGAGAVLNFNLGGAAGLVAVDVDNSTPTDSATYICRATVDGTEPTVARGWRCRSGQTTYLPVPCVAGVVKVFAPAGVNVSVQGGAR